MGSYDIIIHVFYGKMFFYSRIMYHAYCGCVFYTRTTSQFYQPISRFLCNETIYFTFALCETSRRLFICLRVSFNIFNKFFFIHNAFQILTCRKLNVVSTISRSLFIYLFFFELETVNEKTLKLTEIQISNTYCSCYNSNIKI